MVIALGSGSRWPTARILKRCDGQETGGGGIVVTIAVTEGDQCEGRGQEGGIVPIQPNPPFLFSLDVRVAGPAATAPQL